MTCATELTAEENEIVAELNVTAREWEPSDFTARVNVQTTRTWRVGDQIGKSTRRYQRNGWSVASPKMTEVEDAISALLSKVDPHWNEIKEASRGCDVELSLVIYARAFAPAITIRADQLERFAELHASVDVDFYDLV